MGGEDECGRGGRETAEHEDLGAEGIRWAGYADGEDETAEDVEGDAHGEGEGHGRRSHTPSEEGAEDNTTGAMRRHNESDGDDTRCERRPSGAPLAPTGTSILTSILDVDPQPWLVEAYPQPRRREANRGGDGEEEEEEADGYGEEEDEEDAHAGRARVSQTRDADADGEGEDKHHDGREVRAQVNNTNRA